MHETPTEFKPKPNLRLRWIWAIPLLAIGMSCTATAQDSPSSTSKPLSVSELRQRPVIGELGVILGKVVTVQATIISGDSLRTKADQGRYLLKVDLVNDKPLIPAVYFDFYIAPGARGIRVANDHFGLYKLKNGAAANALSSNAIERLENDYVGSQVWLTAYESGSYRGIPSGAGGRWQDVGFQFSTDLRVLEQHIKKTKPRTSKARAK